MRVVGRVAFSAFAPLGCRAVQNRGVKRKERALDGRDHLGQQQACCARFGCQATDVVRCKGFQIDARW